MALTDRDVNSIFGAFWAPDLDLFRLLLGETAHRGPGDLAELGVLLGKSAVLIGDNLGPGETFTVIDLFEDPAADGANQDENELFYKDLTQQTFEDNYRRLLTRLPVVVRGQSASIVDHAQHGSHRFVHVDASHLYEHVVGDIEAARTLMRDDGVLVLDDYRAPHTPGVAAAAWTAVADKGLHPFAVSPQKMYATWGDPDPYLESVTEWAKEAGVYAETQTVLDRSIVRVTHPPRQASRYVPEFARPAVRRTKQAVLRLRPAGPPR